MSDEELLDLIIQLSVFKDLKDLEKPKELIQKCFRNLGSIKFSEKLHKDTTNEFFVESLTDSANFYTLELNNPINCKYSPEIWLSQLEEEMNDSFAKNLEKFFEMDSDQLLNVIFEKRLTQQMWFICILHCFNKLVIK